MNMNMSTEDMEIHYSKLEKLKGVYKEGIEVYDTLDELLISEGIIYSELEGVITNDYIPSEGDIMVVVRRDPNNGVFNLTSFEDSLSTVIARLK